MDEYPKDIGNGWKQLTPVDGSGCATFEAPPDAPIVQMMQGVPVGSALVMNSERMHLSEVVDVGLPPGTWTGDPITEIKAARRAAREALPPLPESCYGPDSVPLEARFRRWLRQWFARWREC